MIEAVGLHRPRVAADGLDAALTARPRTGGPPVRDGKGEAVLIGLARSKPPQGGAPWSAGPLASRLVELEAVEGVFDNTARRVLK